MNFQSDNVYGMHPRIEAALAEANAGTAASYGGDSLTERSEAALSEIFETKVQAFLVTTGTAANGLALASLAPPYGAVFCHAEAHTANDECNGPEFFSGGAKVRGLPGPDAKLAPDTIKATLGQMVRGAHDPKPAAVSVTNATELGTVYSPDEIGAISTLIRSRGLRLHMDGARFANAVVSLGVTPAELTWKSGVDVMSFGATKNGAMLLDAVVFFDRELAEDFVYRRMRAGQLVSKSRFLGAQMLAYLQDGLWLDNARTANALAQRLANGLRNHRDIRLPFPVQANIVFAIMPRALHDRLVASGAKFHRRPVSEINLAEDEVIVRLVTSFATAAADVERFLAIVHNA
jgi:threonine aldolase